MFPTPAESRTDYQHVILPAMLLGLLGLILPAPFVRAEVIHTGLIAYYDLALDPAGHAHAFLDDVDHDRLYYRNNAGGSWSPPVDLGRTSD